MITQLLLETKLHKEVTLFTLNITFFYCLLTAILESKPALHHSLKVTPHLLKISQNPSLPYPTPIPQNFYSHFHPLSPTLYLLYTRPAARLA